MMVCQISYDFSIGEKRSSPRSGHGFSPGSFLTSGWNRSEALVTLKLILCLGHAQADPMRAFREIYRLPSGFRMSDSRFTGRSEGNVVTAQSGRRCSASS
jgi:hypothetical protein